MKQATATVLGLVWAVVTGASSALGREFAPALAERGHPVLAVARHGERIRALAEDVASYGLLASNPVERESVRLNVEAIVALIRGLLPAVFARGHDGVINV